jgi:RNA polymerase sigma factor (sigma-70 family)
MVRRHAGAVLGGLESIFNDGTIAGLSEGDLLERFVAGADETAFAALVSRHGPMVLGVCRRSLRDEHDVEDAFQATFLVLVRRAGSIRDGERVGHWLHGVAHRVAVRARANAARRRLHEQTGIKIDPTENPSPPVDDVPAILDDELVRLPDSLRAPTVLCYLEGLTHDEAAQRLGWPVGTVRSRMGRARELLQRRLTRRGVSVSSAVWFPSLASHPVSTTLFNSTVRIALGVATEKSAATLLAQGVMTAMMISKLKIFASVIVIGAIAVGGVQSFAQRIGGAQPVQAPPQSTEDITGQLTRSLAKINDEEAALKASLAKLAEKRRAVESRLAEAIRSKQPGGDAAQAKPMPNYTRWGDLVVATSPRGDKVSLYYSQTGESKAVRLTESTEPPRRVIPLFNRQLTALYISGPKIGRIAVFNYPDSSWYTQDLREPVETAEPILGEQIVVYSLGSFVYAFSTVANRWDVLELPSGGKPHVIVEPSTATVESGGHIYDFYAKKGKWIELDVRSILDAPETKQ